MPGESEVKHTFPERQGARLMTDQLQGQRVSSAEVAEIFQDSRDWFTVEERAEGYMLIDDDANIHAAEPSEATKYIITGALEADKRILTTVLARRLGRRNHDLVHGGGILWGVGVPPAMILDALQDLPDHIVVVLPLQTLHAMRSLAGSDARQWWWHHLQRFDAIIATNAAFPRDLDLLQDLGLPPLAELEADPGVALCTPTRCDREIVEWLQNGEQHEAVAEEAHLAHLLTGTFASLYEPSDSGEDLNREGE